MNNFEVVKFKSSNELAETVARDWLKELPTTSGSKPYCVALSGGRIARVFFAAVARLGAAASVGAQPKSAELAGVDDGAPRLESVHFFWGDERCVPPTDPESNYGMANELLLRPLGVVPSHIHRVRGEVPPNEAAKEAAAELSRVAAGTEAGQPVLDLVFLGMGEDGHVASLFPNESAEAMASPEVYRAVTAVKPPPRRITLGYAAIAAARQVWVLASGEGKEGALKDSISLNGQTPLARVLQWRKWTKIYSDLA